MNTYLRRTARSSRFLPALAAASLGVISCDEQAHALSPPTPAPTSEPAITGNIPVVIPPHNTNLSPTDSRPFFDTFSWESFIALNWPAAQGQPGVPEQPNNPVILRNAANGSPVVWMSYKTSDDLFSTGTERPKPWITGPTNSSAIQGTKANLPVLARFTKSKSADEMTDTKQAFSFPLVDQNSAYVRYEVRYNQQFYDFVRGDDTVPSSWLYLSKNLAPKEPVTMPAANPSQNLPGALMVKASWREMTPADVSSQRFYVIDAMVQNVDGTTYSPKKMGLVGLHIAQKLPNFPEWIWSTFEQVDNVQRGPGATATTPISFNNGTNVPPTIGGWADRPESMKPTTHPKPVQVTRFNPIPNTPAGNSTMDVNLTYQQALKGTVWQYYELVITQWPSDPKNFKTMESGGVYPTSAGGAFPATGCTNTTMETYFQAPNDAAGAGGNSCMSCHYQAGQADFSWGLMRRAH